MAKETVTARTETTTPKANNGAAPNKEHTEEGAEAAGRRGVVASMPAMVGYRLANGRVVAIIHSPKGGSFKAEGKGIGSAMGELVDSGFTLGPLKADGPVWMADLVPPGVEILGYAAITGFPLPAQS
jgi:hypothetical protein